MAVNMPEPPLSPAWETLLLLVVPPAAILRASRRESSRTGMRESQRTPARRAAGDAGWYSERAVGRGGAVRDLRPSLALDTRRVLQK